MDIYLSWNEVDTNWNATDDNWNLVIEVQNIIKRRGGGISDYIKGNPWNKLRRDIGEEKADKFIRIVCKINGLEYEESIKLNSTIKIEVSHFERTFQSIPNVKIKN